MKYLIAGLGNIGPEYKNTRHNIGFQILDALAEASNISFNNSRYGFLSEYKFKSRTFLLLKPTTYMNLSGRAVNYWLQKEKVAIENLLVLVDDIALPFGTIRVRAKGGAGGHNGLGNINDVLGRKDYTRLRFGVGDDFHQGFQSDYVLSNWNKNEINEMPEKLDTCIEIIKSFGIIGTERTMNFFNKRK